MSFDCAQPAPYCCCESPLHEILRNPNQPRAFRHLAFADLIRRRVQAQTRLYRACLDLLCRIDEF